MIYKEIRQKYGIIFGDIIFGVKMEIIKSNAGGNKLCLNGFLYTKKSESKNIIFVTGDFVHNYTWDDWKIYFESKGYNNVTAPA